MTSLRCLLHTYTYLVSDAYHIPVHIYSLRYLLYRRTYKVSDAYYRLYHSIEIIVSENIQKLVTITGLAKYIRKARSTLASPNVNK
jgi:hypothetical protein